MGDGFTVEFKTKIGRRSDVQHNEKNLLNSRRVPHYLVRNLLEFREVLLVEEAKFTDRERGYFYGYEK